MINKLILLIGLIIISINNISQSKLFDKAYNDSENILMKKYCISV